MNRVWRGLKLGLALIALAGIGFVAMAYLSAALPTTGRSQTPTALPEIHLCTGMAHTDFAIPLALARSERFAPVSKHVPDNLPDDVFVMLGWGDYRFFSEVPTLSELRPGIAFGALTGQHDTALRIQLVSKAYMPEYCRPLPLDRQGQDAIAEHILETIVEPQIILPESTFGLTYLKSNKRYGVFHTCNDWTSDALHKAGLPTARWNAPFAFSVTLPLRSIADD